MWRLKRHDRAQLPTVQKRVFVLRPVNRGIGDEAIGDAIRRNRSLSIEAATVLRDQHEARVRAVVDALRPGVADAKAHVMARALVEIHQQAVPL